MIRQVGVGALAAAAATSTTVTLPAGIIPGDLIVLWAGDREDSPAPTMSASGYTVAGTQAFIDIGTTGVTFSALYKFASGTESNPTVSNGVASTTGIYAFASAYRGVDPTTPFDISVGGGTNAASTTFTPPSVTPTTDLAWVLSAVMTADDNTLTITSAQSFTTDASGASYNTTTGSDTALALTHREITPPASTTLPTYNQSANGSDEWAYKTLVLKPADPEWKELFNGASPGTAVSTSNSTLTGIPTGGAGTFSNDGSFAPNGQRYLKIAGDGVNARIAGRQGHVRTAGNITYYRFYFRTSVIAAYDFWRLYDNTGATVRVRLDLTSGGAINLRDVNTIRYTSSKVLLPYEWVRIELRVNSNNDTLSMRLYWGSQIQASGSPSSEYEEITGLTWTDNVFDEERFGFITTATGECDFDAMAYKDAGTALGAWIGPDTDDPKEVIRLGSGSLAASLSNTATGERQANGSGSLAVAMANSADGAVVPGGGGTVSGDGSLAVGFSDAAAGERQANGSGSLAASLSNTATGVRSANGSGSLAVVFSNAATGALTKATSASIAVSMSNTATGVVEHNGSGSLAVAFADSATPQLTTSASGSLAISFSDSATGSLIKSGSASLPVSLTNSASGEVGSIAALAVTFSNTAAGMAERNGSGSLTVAFANSATGQLVKGSSASLAVTFSNTATPNRVQATAASLAVSLADSAAGTRVAAASASLPVVFADTATAGSEVNADADLPIDVTLSASGQIPGAAVPTVGQLWPRGGA